jgi:hypothetical protein
MHDNEQCAGKRLSNCPPSLLSILNTIRMETSGVIAKYLFSSVETDTVFGSILPILGNIPLEGATHSNVTT